DNGHREFLAAHVPEPGVDRIPGVPGSADHVSAASGQHGVHAVRLDAAGFRHRHRLHKQLARPQECRSVLRRRVHGRDVGLSQPSPRRSHRAAGQTRDRPHRIPLSRPGPARPRAAPNGFLPPPSIQAFADAACRNSIMNGTLSLSPGLVMRDLLLSGFNKRRLILILVACVMVLGVQIALTVEPDYRAKSSLLVLLGTEHSFRPPAGQQFLNSGGVDSEQVLRTEASILASDDLHRSVIRELGVEHLYPKLLKPPSTISRWMHAAKLWIAETTGNTALNSPDGTKDDPLARAVDLFARNLTINVDKKSSVIELYFNNPDPTMASDALKVLEKDYFELRTKLYGDVQAPIVKVQQENVGKQLADADTALAAFKQQHDISSFTDRRTILLKQQGDLETALAKSESTIAEQEARLKQLNQQLGAVTGSKKGTPNASAALQGMVQAYRQRQADAQTHYRGSPAVDEARRQMLERETDIAKMQSTQAFATQTDRNKTEADLRASLSGHDTIEAQLDAINKQIDALDK